MRRRKWPATREKGKVCPFRDGAQKINVCKFIWAPISDYGQKSRYSTSRIPAHNERTAAKRSPLVLCAHELESSFFLFLILASPKELIIHKIILWRGLANKNRNKELDVETVRAAFILCVPAVSAYSYSLIPDMLEHIKYAAYAQIFLSHGLFIFCASTGLYSLVFAGGWLHRKCGRGPTEWLAIRNRQHNILWEKENSDTESPLTYVHS